MVEETLAARDDASETFASLKQRTAAAEEAAATNTRRVGVLEEVARGVERRQKRTERLVEDVRRAWSAASAERDAATMRAVAAGETLTRPVAKRSALESEDTSALTSLNDSSRDSSDDDSGSDEE